MSTFSTENLKQLTSYAIQGAGFSKLFELSSYIGIKVKDEHLCLNTTDGTNYLCVEADCQASDIDVVVNAELFSRLISKITSDTVDINVVDNSLVITGNGKYTLELVPDEMGNVLTFPNKFPAEVEDLATIGALDVVSINSTVKASLNTVSGSVYSSYYFGDVIASTDRCMMTIFNKQVFDTPYMINREFVELMAMGCADVTLSKADDLLVATCKVNESCTIRVCTKIPTNVDEFKIDGIKKFAALEVTSFCRVRKTELLDLLDRLSLFVSKFDDGAIQMEFTPDCIEISSIASNSVEQIEFVESKDAIPLTIKINIDRLRTQLKSYNSDVVDLYYGSDICIKLVDGDISQIIALIK